MVKKAPKMVATRMVKGAARARAPLPVPVEFPVVPVDGEDPPVAAGPEPLLEAPLEPLAPLVAAGTELEPVTGTAEITLPLVTRRMVGSAGQRSVDW